MDRSVLQKQWVRTEDKNGNRGVFPRRLVWLWVDLVCWWVKIHVSRPARRVADAVE